jgi:TnpA family transposase
LVWRSAIAACAPPWPAPTTTAIELQGAARQGDASFRAGHAHGLLLRTNDLLRSYTDPDYRREKLRYLNHNERTHELQRQIRHAGSGSARGKRQEELGAQSHCLALCTNLVMAYNTSHLQRTLDTWRKQSISPRGRCVDSTIHLADGL